MNEKVKKNIMSNSKKSIFNLPNGLDRQLIGLLLVFYLFVLLYDEYLSDSDLFSGFK